ncbi:Carboxylic ester hydrolase [Mycena kentingensis (nom. inval.)]|nr:Carboxylic ester hydrolase [Mycena kentingensis (nom. inval.)]
MQTINLEFVAFGLFLVGALASGPVVDLGYASYEGAAETTTNITSFLGMRYADAPTGSLRFRAPEAPGTISGVQSATTEPPQCIQLPILSTGTAETNPFRMAVRAPSTEMSEDCLFLSVHYPSDASGKPLPSTSGRGLSTVVWIHGGAAIERVEAGSCGKEVRRGGALNAGLLDQELALKWVQKYIHDFGGDSGQVTIWGQSAGAGSVLQHIIAHDGRTFPPLFANAITSSTFLPSQYRYNDDISEELFGVVVAGAGCTNVSVANKLSCLRAVDTAILAAVNANISAAAFSGTSVFVPVVEGPGGLITRSSIEALAKGAVNGQRILSITNTFEGTLMVNASVSATQNLTQYAFELFPKLSWEQAAQAGEMYANVPGGAATIIGEGIFICPTYPLLRAFKDARAFKGQFSVAPAIHGLDLEYYFPSLATDVPPFTLPSAFFNNSAFIDAFAGGFERFASSGSPGGGIAGGWTPWTREDDREMVFAVDADGRPAVQMSPTDAGLLRRCAFWESLVGSIGQ